MKIAIVGATGIVGRKVLKILEEKKMFGNDVLLFASKKYDSFPNISLHNSS